MKTAYSQGDKGPLVTFAD